MQFGKRDRHPLLAHFNDGPIFITFLSTQHGIWIGIIAKEKEFIDARLFEIFIETEN